MIQPVFRNTQRTKRTSIAITAIKSREEVPWLSILAFLALSRYVHTRTRETRKENYDQDKNDL